MSSRNRTYKTVLLSHDEAERVQREAGKKGESVSGWIAQAIRARLDGQTLAELLRSELQEQRAQTLDAVAEQQSTFAHKLALVIDRLGGDA
ncbi:hypothetical protein GCM10027285_10850 [Oleiagrimonas citrea]|uniref:Uncharacterized protein n=1 Tax=Oleiagrimonas citrea TaxID=1665687 RepID=A0A846ZJJ1_9GAMM|nr:hypothetical protein [Oleiagrimonas citrea]NKZ38354.1 hypothetical protein [Oleiagrimonas citrea]